MMNVLQFYSPGERFALLLGTLCSIILGCCVPSAVFCVGEVVNLFIRNRRARLASLVQHEHQLGHNDHDDITDYDDDTDTLMDELSKDLDETAAILDSNNGSVLNDSLHGNATVAEELLLNQVLNLDFLERLHFLICALVVISCTQFVSASTMTLTFNICTRRMARRLRKMIQLENFMNNEEDKEHSFNLMLKNVELIEKGFGEKFPHIIFGCVTLTANLIFAFCKRWELAAILLPVLIVVLFGKAFTTKMQLSYNQKLIKATSESKMLLQDSFENLATVAAFQGEGTEIHRYDDLLSRVRSATDHRMAVIGICSGFVTMIPHILNAVMLWFGVRLVIADLNSSFQLFLPGALVVVFFCYLRGLLTFHKGWIFYDDIKSAFVASKQLVTAIRVLRIRTTPAFLENNLQFSDGKVKKLQGNEKQLFMGFGDRRLRTPSAVHRLAFPMNSSRLRFSSLDERKSNEIGSGKETLMLLLKFIAPDFIYLIFGCISSISLGVIFPMLFYTFCEIIGAMANLEDEVVYRRTTMCVIIYSSLGAATLLGTYLQNQMNGKVAVKLGNRLRKGLFVTFLKKAELDYESSMKTLKTLQRLISQDVAILEKAIVSVCGPGLQFFSAVAASVPIAMKVQWTQALFLSLIIPTLFSAYVAQYYFVFRNPKQKIKAAKKEKHSWKALKQNLIEAALNGCFCAIREMAFGTILLYGGQLIVHNGVSNKDILQVNLVIINPVLQIGQVVTSGVDALKGWRSMKKISGYLLTNFTNENKISYSSQSSSRILPMFEALDVVLHKEAKTWTNENTVQQGFTFTAQSGQIVKLIDNHNDRELCLHTLLGLKKPARGKILINGVDIDLLSPSWMRRHMSVADDSFPFFNNRTIMENLSYGNTIWNGETIANLLTKSKLLSAIEKLPKGLQSVYRDASTQLSVEENRKLILIRCLLRSPSILILGEDYVFGDLVEHADDGILVIISSGHTTNEQNTT